MSDLIKALQIFLKYGDEKYPIHCEHDVMYVYSVAPEAVSEEDKITLAELGFIVNDDLDCFESYRFGSC